MAREHAAYRAAGLELAEAAYHTGPPTPCWRPGGW
jgi:hypothetical protein